MGEQEIVGHLNQSFDEPTDIRPFLRWAGSKRKLLRHLIPFVPKNFNKYFEPFLGGGSMFFYLGPKRAEISDASLPLIETYRAVAKSPLEMLKFLRPLKPSKANFIRLRQYPRTLRRFRTVRIPTVDDVGVRYK